MSVDDRRIVSFKIPCYFSGVRSEVDIHVGRPNEKNNPIQFQNKFLQDVKGGVIPPEIIDSLAKLKDLAEKHGASLQELCEHAFSALSAENETNDLLTEQDSFSVSEEDEEAILGDEEFEAEEDEDEQDVTEAEAPEGDEAVEVEAAATAIGAGEATADTAGMEGTEAGDTAEGAADVNVPTVEAITITAAAAEAAKTTTAAATDTAETKIPSPQINS